jgi:DNA-binding MarR family transcriptional regulator
MVTMPTKYTGLTGELLYLNALRKNRIQKMASDINISAEQFPILEYIKKNPGCMQADVAKRCSISAAAVTQTMHRLENSGLIKRDTDPENQRAKRLYITDKGLKATADGTLIFDKIDSLMFNDFSDEESQELLRLLKKVNNNLTNINV